MNYHKKASKRLFNGLALSPFAKIEEPVVTETAPTPQPEPPSTPAPKRGRGRPKSPTARTPDEQKRVERERKKNAAAIAGILKHKVAAWGPESIRAATGGNLGVDDDALALAEAKQQMLEEYGGVATGPKQGSDDHAGGGGCNYNFNQRAKEQKRAGAAKELAQQIFDAQTITVYRCGFCGLRFEWVSECPKHLEKAHPEKVTAYLRP
jgi:hypothetical protein